MSRIGVPELWLYGATIEVMVFPGHNVAIAGTSRASEIRTSRESTKDPVEEAHWIDVDGDEAHCVRRLDRESDALGNPRLTLVLKSDVLEPGLTAVRITVPPHVRVTARLFETAALAIRDVDALTVVKGLHSSRVTIEGSPRAAYELFGSSGERLVSGQTGSKNAFVAFIGAGPDQDVPQLLVDEAAEPVVPNPHAIDVATKGLRENWFEI